MLISPHYSFESFKNTEYYDNQDGIKTIHLKKAEIIDNRKYMVNLFFLNKEIYVVSLICCDCVFSAKNEHQRKQLHDKILKENGINQKNKYAWGKIESNYDKRSNLSSIDIIYTKGAAI